MWRLLAREVCHRLVGGVVLLLALTLGQRAHAETATEPQRVAVHAVGELSSHALERALDAWFLGGRYQLDFITEPALDPRRLLAPAPDHVLHAWLSLEAGFVYVRLARSDQAPAHARYLLRRLQLVGKLDLLALEQVAQMAHSSIEALLEEQSATPEDEFLETLPEAARRAPAPPPSRSVADKAALTGPPRAPKVAARLAFALLGRASSASSWMYGPGLSAGVTWRVAHWRLGPVARVSYALPSRVRQRDLELTFRSQSVSVELAFSQASAFGYDVALGPHLERTKLDVRSLDRTLAAEAVPTDLRWNALFIAGAHWNAWGMRVALQALLLLPIPGATFVLAEPRDERIVLSPWRAQPGALIEIGPVL